MKISSTQRMLLAIAFIVCTSIFTLLHVCKLFLSLKENENSLDGKVYLNSDSYACIACIVAGIVTLIVLCVNINKK